MYWKEEKFYLKSTAQTKVIEIKLPVKAAINTKQMKINKARILEIYCRLGSVKRTRYSCWWHIWHPKNTCCKITPSIVIESLGSFQSDDDARIGVRVDRYPQYIFFLSLWELWKIHSLYRKRGFLFGIIAYPRTYVVDHIAWHIVIYRVLNIKNWWSQIRGKLKQIDNSINSLK